MKLAHGMKVEGEGIKDLFGCPQCSFLSKNMNDMKNHMINEHKKDEWNWGLKIRLKFICGECDLEFVNNSMMKRHIESGHIEVGGTIVDENVKKIKPDKDFLTKNTMDLEDLLKNLPMESFYSAEAEFQDDLKEILDVKGEQDEYENHVKINCDLCKFRGKSKKVMRVHHKFVHDQKFYTCNTCGIKTRTVGAMKTHMWHAHKVISTYKEPTKVKYNEINVEVRPEVTNNSSESEDEITDSDFEDLTLPNLYLEKEWKSGKNFKSRTPAFRRAVNDLKKLLLKSEKERKVDDINIRVLDVKIEDTSKVAEIQITDKEGAGQVKLTTWDPNKRTKMVPIQISKSNKGEVRHVELLATQVVKPLLDKLLNGETVKIS